MKIYIKAKPLARENVVEKIDDNHFVVKVTAAPEKNRANLAIIRALAEYFDIAPSNVVILSGRSSREKIIKIKI